MSEETIPIWGTLLKERVFELATRVAALEETSASKPALTPEGASPEKPLLEANIPAGLGEAELNQRRQESERIEREIESAQKRLAEADKAATEAGKKADAEIRRGEDAHQRLTDRAAVLQAEAESLTQTRRVIERLWPRFLLTEGFAEWRDGIEKAILQDAPPPSAALLFANLHGYTACLLENDLKYLRDVLRDISRFLYAWIKENRHDERSAFQIALAWAAAINEECAGRLEIEVPEPGTPANSLSMTFPPRGSSPEVASVRTWCVRDAQRRVIHRAEVFT